ncbi:reverse transcriptase domain-containing protein [Trichonephila clavipes]|nr:reverse transcriptase domain-containing protein [Trichonephila clavipes]
MNSAILSDTDNVTAFGVADASRVEVRAHDEKYATRTLNILQLNINGAQRKIEELTAILNVNKVHIVCLQETKLNPNLKLKIKGFTILRKDRKDRAGYLNAKRPSWGSRTLDLKGSQIEHLLCDNDLSILNDKRSTYLSKTYGTTSALDTTAINHQTASQATWKILKSAISDHFLIITSINQRVDGTIQSKISWNFRKANWGKFTSELETLCSLSSPHTLDERLQSFASHINAAAKRSIPRVKRRDWVPFWKDTNIENLINERDKLSTELQKNNTETNRIRFTKLCHEVEEVVSSCKRKKWTEFCETLDPQKISQHWKVIKTLNNQSTHQKADILTNIISSSGRDAATNKETASLLANYYKNKSKLTFNANDRKLLRTYRKTIQDSKKYNHKNIFIIPFLMEELEAAIAKMNRGKAPGPDVVFGRMVQHFENLAKKELLEIFNLSWATGKLPKIWKLSTVIPILKPNKNASECKNYRPISLTSTLCKLMERNSQIKKVDLPTYLGVTLDSELRFSKHIEKTANKALGKLNILRKLSGTSWGPRPHTLKSTFCTVIRPILEYATPIWTPISVSVKRKLDSVQHRAANIIIGAMSSTNDEKAEQECGLSPIESRRKLSTIKFTNKLRSYGLDHISRRGFDKWKHSTRLKRSSTLQLDSEIRKELNLEHSTLEFLQDPLIPKNPPKNICFELELLQPCSKKKTL